MKFDKYVIQVASSFLKFEFTSDGPKGKIIKQVVYKSFPDSPTVYNLGFGDVDVNGGINDIVVTNNNDSQKVLATVALTVYKFFENYPGCYVYATGSTDSRTRLYRMGISNNIVEITEDFEVFGYLDDNWQIFEKEINYEAFLIKQKL